MGGRGLVVSALFIHPSAWNRNSANFGCRGFSAVRIRLDLSGVSPLGSSDAYPADFSVLDLGALLQGKSAIFVSKHTRTGSLAV